MPEAEGAGRVDGTHAGGRHGIRARVGEDLQHFLNCRRQRELQQEHEKLLGLIELRSGDHFRGRASNVLWGEVHFIEAWAEADRP